MGFLSIEWKRERMEDLYRIWRVARKAKTELVITQGSIFVDVRTRVEYIHVATSFMSVERTQALFDAWDLARKIDRAQRIHAKVGRRFAGLFTRNVELHDEIAECKRLLEIANERAVAQYRPGVDVLYERRGRRGEFVDAYAAKVVATTTKRVIIAIEGEGKPRYVSPLSLEVL